MVNFLTEYFHKTRLFVLEAVFKFVHDTDVKELYVKFSHPSFPIDQNLCTKILKARQTKSK